MRVALFSVATSGASTAPSGLSPRFSLFFGFFSPPSELIRPAPRKKAAARDVVNKDMRYVYAWDDLSEEGVSILTGAGADGAHPDLDELKKDRY